MIQEPVVEETPTRLPGTCASCGSTQLSPGRVWFLDTDMDYFDTPSYRIQICNICFDVLANTCGYIRKGEEVEQYRNRIAQLEAELNGLDKYRRVVDMLGLGTERIDYLLAVGEGIMGSDTNDNLDTSAKKRSRAKQSAGTVGEGAERSSESSDDEGMDKLRSVDESLHIQL